MVKYFFSFIASFSCMRRSCSEAAHLKTNKHDDQRKTNSYKKKYDFKGKKISEVASIQFGTISRKTVD